MVVLGAAWGDVACIFGEGDVCLDPFRAGDLTVRTGTDLLPCFFLSDGGESMSFLQHTPTCVTPFFHLHQNKRDVTIVAHCVFAVVIIVF